MKYRLKESSLDNTCHGKCIEDTSWIQEIVFYFWIELYVNKCNTGWVTSETFKMILNYATYSIRQTTATRWSVSLQIISFRNGKYIRIVRWWNNTLWFMDVLEYLRTDILSLCLNLAIERQQKNLQHGVKGWVWSSHQTTATNLWSVSSKNYFIRNGKYFRNARWCSSGISLRTSLLIVYCWRGSMYGNKRILNVT